MISLIKLSSLVLSTLFFATIHAQTVQFTNNEYPTLPVRKQFNLTWSGDGSPVSITLVQGPVTNLVPVRLITKNNPNNTYTWTPSAILAPGIYALAITQSSTPGFTNYSPRFNITGGDGPPSMTLEVTASFDHGLATTVVGVGAGASSSVGVVVSEILPKGVGLVTSAGAGVGAAPTAPAPAPLAPGEEILSVTARFKSVGGLATTIATVDGSRVGLVVSAGQLPPGVGYTTSSKSKTPKSKTPKTNVKPPYPYVTGTGAGYPCANETGRATVWLGTPTPTPSPSPILNPSQSPSPSPSEMKVVEAGAVRVKRVEGVWGWVGVWAGVTWGVGVGVVRWWVGGL